MILRVVASAGKKNQQNFFSILDKDKSIFEVDKCQYLNAQGKKKKKEFFTLFRELCKHPALKK